MSTLKKGDIVQIKSLEWFEENSKKYGYVKEGKINYHIFSLIHSTCCGKRCIITNIHYDSRSEYPIIDLELEEESPNKEINHNVIGLIWEPWMFEGYKSEEPKIVKHSPSRRRFSKLGKYIY